MHEKMELPEWKQCIASAVTREGTRLVVHLTDDDKVIRALVRRALELSEDSAEYDILGEEIFANAKLAYGEAARERLQVFIAEIIGLKDAEAQLEKRLDFSN